MEVLQHNQKRMPLDTILSLFIWVHMLLTCFSGRNFNIILCLFLFLPSGLFGHFPTKILYTFLFFPHALFCFSCMKSYMIILKETVPCSTYLDCSSFLGSRSHLYSCFVHVISCPSSEYVIFFGEITSAFLCTML